MRRITLPILPGLALFSFILTEPNAWAQAANASAQTKAYHCVAYVRRGNTDVRYSSGPVRTGAPISSLSAAWKQEVVSSYHISDPRMRSGCQILSGIPDRQENAVHSLEEHWKTLGAEVIHVNWSSAPGQAATEVSARPAQTRTAAAGRAAAATPANSAATRSPAGAPQQAAQAVPLAQDPRLAQIPSRIRGMIISDATGYESACERESAPGGKSRCECIARNILNYRIAHANEYHMVYEEHDLVGHVEGWQPRTNPLVEEAKQGCTP